MFINVHIAVGVIGSKSAYRKKKWTSYLFTWCFLVSHGNHFRFMWSTSVTFPDEMKRKRLNKKLVTSQTRLYVEKKICLWWRDCTPQLAETYWFWNILPCNKWVHKPLGVLNKILNWLARKPSLPGNIDWPGWAGLIDS